MKEAQITSNAGTSYDSSRSYRKLLEKDEIRMLLGGTGVDMAFEKSNAVRAAKSTDAVWRPLSREVVVHDSRGSDVVMETAAMTAPFGCLVRCVVYTTGGLETGAVHNVSMEFVPNARLRRIHDPESGRTSYRLA